MPKTVAYLGLGTMGSAMANNLVKAGYTVRGYDPSPEACAQAEKSGILIFSSPAEATAVADVVCSSVPVPEDVVEAYTGETGVLVGAAEGTVCFDFSTITPEVSQEVAAEARKRGVFFLDTPVGGSAPHAAEALLTVMVGGDKDAMEKHRDVLEAVSRSITYVGPNGAGLRMKLIANHLVSGQLCLLAEGLTLGQKAGLDVEQLVEYLLGSAVSEIMRVKGREMGRKDYTPTFKVDLMAKDLRLVAAMAESVKAPIPFSALTKQVFTGTQALGHGSDDQNAVREYFERVAGLNA